MAGLVLAGCGDDGGAESADDGDAEAPALLGDVFEVDDATDALLELSDLPEGWSTQFGPEVTPPEGGFVVLPCGGELDNAEDLTDIGTAVSHIDPTETRGVNQAVRVHVDAEAAQAVLDATAEAREGCETWTQTSGEREVELRLLADPPDVGPRGDAVDVYAVDDSQGTHVTVTQIRCGPVISRVLVVEPPDEIDPDLTTATLDAAEARLQRVIEAAGGTCG